MLLFESNVPEARLLAAVYFIASDSETPPSGFTGPNDRWHRHVTDKSACVASGVIRTELPDKADCTASGRRNAIRHWLDASCVVRTWGREPQRDIQARPLNGVNQLHPPAVWIHPDIDSSPQHLGFVWSADASSRSKQPLDHPTPVLRSTRDLQRRRTS